MRKTYSKYKSSEVEWIGEIPTHWDCGKMKYVLSNNDGGVWGNEVENEEEGNIVVRSTEITIDGNWDFSNPLKRILTENEISKSKLYEGDIVITKSSGSPQHIGKSVIVSKEIELMNCCYSNFVQRIRFRNYNPKLYHFILNSDIGRSQFKYLTTSSTGLGNLNGSSLNDVLLPFIPLNEQEQIVKYLDEKTTQIDNLISITEDKIDLLKQKRTSQINEVVTKGLNKEVKLKDSGVEWIGDIPKHWELSKFKYVSEIVTGNTPSKIDGGEYYCENENVGYLWVKPTSLNVVGYVNNSEEKLTELGKKQTRLVPKDSIMICCIGNTIGKYGMSGQELSTNQQINSVIPNQSKVKPWFYFYFIDVFTRDLLNRSNFVTLPILTKSDLENIEVIIPPIEEQQEIVTYIDTETKKIDELISIEEIRINTLKEYRHSLISEVITGKIKVTD